MGGQFPRTNGRVSWLNGRICLPFLLSSFLSFLSLSPSPPPPLPSFSIISSRKTEFRGSRERRGWTEARVHGHGRLQLRGLIDRKKGTPREAPCKFAPARVIRSRTPLTRDTVDTFGYFDVTLGSIDFEADGPPPLLTLPLHGPSFRGGATRGSCCSHRRAGNYGQNAEELTAIHSRLEQSRGNGLFPTVLTDRDDTRIPFPIVASIIVLSYRIASFWNVFSKTLEPERRFVCGQFIGVKSNLCCLALSRLWLRLLRNWGLVRILGNPKLLLKNWRERTD